MREPPVATDPDLEATAAPMIPTRALLLQRLLHTAASVGGIAVLIAALIECGLLSEQHNRLL